MIEPYYQEDGITLYCGDCREILPQFKDKEFDLVLTDPPYGIDYNPNIHKKYNGQESTHSRIINDNEEIDLSIIFNMSCYKIIWGAENFPHQLPHHGRWICWSKRSSVTKPNSMPSSDFELAWMDRKTGFYKFINIIHGGCINADSLVGNNEPRLHPTQKPIQLFRWCIELYPDVRNILDPFCGSGTTLVAAKQLGRKAVGIEISEKYCEIAVKRLAQMQLEFA